MEDKIWYRELGYYNNPFSIKPAAFTDKVHGYEELVNEIVTNIHASGLLFIEGDYGEGKTTILKRLINEFGGHRKVIYFSCNRIEQRLNVKKLLNDKYGFFGRLLDLQPKNMILLLDEAQMLDDKDYEKLMRYYESGNFLSVVFVGKQYDPTTLPERLRRLIKVVRLEKLSNDDAVKLIKLRVGSLQLLDDETIAYVFNKVGMNPRMLLKACEELCRMAFERGDKKVTIQMVDKLLNVKLNVDKAPMAAPVAHVKPVVKEEPAEEKLFVEKDEVHLEDDFEEELEAEEEVYEEKPKQEARTENNLQNPKAVAVEPKSSNSVDTDYY